MKLLFWRDPNDELEIIEFSKEATDEYGHYCGSEIVRLKPEHIEALKNGKMIAFNDSEYATFLVYEDE